MAVAFTRCARPEFGRVSTYTVLGFAGYALASGLASALFVAWNLALADRIIGALVPPLAFLVVVVVSRAILGRERIVFYQTAAAGVVGVAVAAAVAGDCTGRLIDVATIGIGTFLVFGRIGCFAVACCHGRPARFGVVYGPAHVGVGLPARWSDRPLWPTQLVESGASLVLVISGLNVGWDEPGLPATVYIAGYAVIRFLLGDASGMVGRRRAPARGRAVARRRVHPGTHAGHGTRDGRVAALYRGLRGSRHGFGTRRSGARVTSTRRHSNGSPPERYSTSVADRQRKSEYTKPSVHGTWSSR